MSCVRFFTSIFFEKAQSVCTLADFDFVVADFDILNIEGNKLSKEYYFKVLGDDFLQLILWFLELGGNAITLTSTADVTYSITKLNK